MGDTLPWWGNPNGGFPCGSEQCQPRDGVGQTKVAVFPSLPMELFSGPFLVFFCGSVCLFVCFCSPVLLKFLKSTPELAQDCFCSWIAVQLSIFVPGQALGSPLYCHFVNITLCAYALRCHIFTFRFKIFSILIKKKRW